MTTPIETLSGLKIGTIESVSSNQFKVVLELDAPQSTALNAGVPTAFPRVNNYVLIPTEGSCVVGMIVWIGIELSTYPKRKGLKDFDLVDLPFPIRRMTITPVGTLIHRRGTAEQPNIHLDRGVHSFPSVGDSVLLPSATQLKAIIEAEGKDRRLVIGRSALATEATVSVDPDKLFGRHLAVLGNTGSGKSCSVAGLIRWSLEAAKQAQVAPTAGNCNARFLILDPNGEYGQAFDDLGAAVRRFRVIPQGSQKSSASQGGPSWAALRVPAWLWNSHEWCSFASAAPGVQRPLLLQGLRNMRAGQTLSDNKQVRAIRLFGSYKRMVHSKVAEGATAFADGKGATHVGTLLQQVARDATEYADSAGDEFDLLAQAAVTLYKSHDASFPDKVTKATVPWFRPFSETDLTTFAAAIETLIEKCKSVVGSAATTMRAREDAPIPFELEEMADHIKQLAVEVGSANASQFADFLAMRIEMTLNDGRMRPVINPENMPSFVEWLTENVGSDGAANGPIAIVDLSLVPADVLQMLIAVLGRLVFDVVQRYRRLNGVELPTVIVLEEAHAFVRRSQDDSSGFNFAAAMCRDTFDRIAREGRKFGLGLVLSSQRPSELSQTVLAQCNTFLLHRLMNDRDQEFVKSLVPEKLGGLLSDLPNLPTRQAILLGWATPIPVLVEMRELSKEHRPQSSDPEFWDVWTGQSKRHIDWQALADDWTS